MSTLESAGPGAAAASGQNKRRVRNLLIDRRFQLKYTLIVVAITAITAGILGFLFYRQIEENTTLAMDQIVNLAREEAHVQKTRDALQKGDRGALLFLVATLGGFLLVLTALGIAITHRVAGPVFMMTRHLRQIGNGSLRDVRPLRRGDELREFFDAFQQTLAALRDREKRDIAALEAAVKSLHDHVEGLGTSGPEEARAAVSSVIETLAQLKKRKQEALG